MVHIRLVTEGHLRRNKEDAPASAKAVNNQHTRDQSTGLPLGRVRDQNVVSPRGDLCRFFYGLHGPDIQTICLRLAQQALHHPQRGVGLRLTS